MKRHSFSSSPKVSFGWGTPCASKWNRVEGFLLILNIYCWSRFQTQAFFFWTPGTRRMKYFIHISDIFRRHNFLNLCIDSTHELRRWNEWKIRPSDLVFPCFHCRTEFHFRWTNRLDDLFVFCINTANVKSQFLFWKIYERYWMKN